MRLARSRAIRVLALATALVAGATVASGQGPARPDPRSPLATDGQTVYAVAPDRQTVIATRIQNGRDWEVVTRVDGAELRGLAWLRGRLYLSDAKSARILSIPTGGDAPAVPSVVHAGAPLVRPGELTFTGDLVVADGGAGLLFRLRILANDAAPRPLDTGDARVDADTYIAGWPAGELLMSNPARGLLLQVSDLTGEEPSPRLWAMQQRREPGQSPVQRNQDPLQGQVSSVRRRGYAAVERPSSLAVYNGLVYVVDAQSNRVFTANIHDARSVRLPLAGSEDLQVTRLLVTPPLLLALDGRSGRVVSWPRLVPVEIRYVDRPAPEALGAVYEYLARRKLLPWRAVRVGESLALTLRAEGVLPRSGDAEAALPGMKAALCALNSSLCRGGELPRQVDPGTSIAIPDLYAERYVSATRTTLDGSRSLGEIVDEAIASPEFKTYTTETYLREANGIAADPPAPLREARAGSFRISQEQTRFVATFEASELRGNTDFKRLVTQLSKVLRIIPLERVVTEAAGLQNTKKPHPNDPNCEAARGALQQLHKTIQFVATKSTKLVTVGVAEASFDTKHPDFVDANGVQVFRGAVVNEAQAMPEPPAAAATAADPETIEPIVWRDIQADDHGTAVASLIAARTRPYLLSPDSGSSVFLAPLTHAEDATALAQDITTAIGKAHTTVINLSLKSSESPALLSAIEDSKEMAVFVAAAPNLDSGTRLCSPAARIYPACWRGQGNLIVVGGTSLDGAAIHPKSPIGEAIDLFAPEAGYFAAGRNNAYVAVEGTSFATALVSSAAAMLSGLGIESPVLIKQRLVSTATLMRIPGHPEWARLLSIRRAVTDVDYAVLVDANTGSERAVSLEDREQPLEFALAQGNRKVAIGVGQVRRLTRDEDDQNTFHLAFVDSVTDQLVLIRVRAPKRSWPFCYQPLDAGRNPVGPRTCGDLAEYRDYVGPIR